jgi:RNA recognition motif-containing protein
MQIYVGNMSYQMTEDSLSAVFAEFGEVSKTVIISDRETGRAKGFGFITMNNDEEAKAAIEALNEKEVEGRTLRVNEAKPREERPRNDFNRY